MENDNFNAPMPDANMGQTPVQPPMPPQPPMPEPVQQPIPQPMPEETVQQPYKQPMQQPMQQPMLQEPYGQPQYQQPMPQQPYGQPYYQQPYEAPKKKSKLWLWLTIAGILLAGGIVALILLLGGKKDDAPATTSTTEGTEVIDDRDVDDEFSDEYEEKDDDSGNEFDDEFESDDNGSDFDDFGETAENNANQNQNQYQNQNTNTNTTTTAANTSSNNFVMPRNLSGYEKVACALSGTNNGMEFNGYGTLYVSEMEPRYAYFDGRYMYGRDTYTYNVQGRYDTVSEKFVANETDHGKPSAKYVGNVENQGTLLIIRGTFSGNGKSFPSTMKIKLK